MKRHLKKFLMLFALGSFLLFESASALLVNYNGGNGLSASADYTLLGGGSTLHIILTNTSTTPFGGVDGDASMVLSSLNFDLGSVLIAGGSVALNTGSNVVQRLDPPGPDPAFWETQTTPDLNSEYGFSNTGIGNTGTGVIVGALNAVTSHSNGGAAVTDFNGGTGPLPGGLDYGLVAAGSTPFGNNEFILDSIILDLVLDSSLLDLSFLQLGSYVEFGSDHLFVPDTPTEPVIPEPVTLSLVALGLSGVGLFRRRIYSACPKA